MPIVGIFLEPKGAGAPVGGRPSWRPSGVLLGGLLNTDEGRKSSEKGVCVTDGRDDRRVIEDTLPGRGLGAPAVVDWAAEAREVMHERAMQARPAVAPGGAVETRPVLDFELLESDGEPLETRWHVLQINLFIDVVTTTMKGRGRRDFFVGGNMFVYYDPAQARGIATDPGTREHFKGPDAFYVSGVEPGDRDYWVTWEEGCYPEVILELLSPSTAATDRGSKKTLYERTFRTPEYFLYDRGEAKPEGFRRVAGRYRPIAAGPHGVWCQHLDAYLGVWQGNYLETTATWVRLFDREGRLLPTAEEREHQRAENLDQRLEQERQRAEAAEAEVARLRAQLSESSGPRSAM